VFGRGSSRRCAASSARNPSNAGRSRSRTRLSIGRSASS